MSERGNGHMNIGMEQSCPLCVRSPDKKATSLILQDKCTTCRQTKTKKEGEHPFKPSWLHSRRGISDVKCRTTQAPRTVTINLICPHTKVKENTHKNHIKAILAVFFRDETDGFSGRFHAVLIPCSKRKPPFAGYRVFAVCLLRTARKSSNTPEAYSCASGGSAATPLPTASSPPGFM